MRILGVDTVHILKLMAVALGWTMADLTAGGDNGSANGLPMGSARADLLVPDSDCTSWDVDLAR